MQIKTIHHIKQNTASLNVEEAIATLKLMNLAERDIRNQNLLSLSEAKERLGCEVGTKKFEP
ncbi:hypothetical protein [Idiomarina loihiensis]|uniref:hypothetical protein n=1 Tax=Idiomarina loihiensis TaxID=135577 RepID=UPI00384C455E